MNKQSKNQNLHIYNQNLEKKDKHRWEKKKTIDVKIIDQSKGLEDQDWMTVSNQIIRGKIKAILNTCQK